MTAETILLAAEFEPTDRSQATRRNLIVAALGLFGSKGFEATTTRQISEAANANIAAISYHFGSKENLRIEVARSVAALLQFTGSSRVTAHLDEAGIDALTPDQARVLCRQHIATMLNPTHLGPFADDLRKFFHQEITRDTPVADVLFKGVMEGNHQRMCRLVSRITGHPHDSEQTRAAALMVFGQGMVFNLTRPIALRALGWDQIGDRERDVILENLWLS